MPTTPYGDQTRSGQTFTATGPDTVEKGRTDMDVASLAELLHETAQHHDTYEKVAPVHDWWDWYAAYLDARQHGASAAEATEAAGRYMTDVKGVVTPV